MTVDPADDVLVEYREDNPDAKISDSLGNAIDPAKFILNKQDFCASIAREPFEKCRMKNNNIKSV